MNIIDLNLNTITSIVLIADEYYSIHCMSTINSKNPLKSMVFIFFFLYSVLGTLEQP